MIALRLATMAGVCTEASFCQWLIAPGADTGLELGQCYPRSSNLRLVNFDLSRLIASVTVG